MEGTKGHLKEICRDPERSQEITECLSKNLSMIYTTLSTTSTTNYNTTIAVCEDHMDITKGSLDDISRPASSDRSHAGSRESFSEIRRDGHRSLEVLSPDVTDMRQVQESTHEMSDCEEHKSDHDSDGEAKDSDLEKALKKMKKLDEILSHKVSVEREVKRKSRELHQRLWQELKAVRASPESSDEMDNTRRFLLLTPESFQDCGEDVDFVPLFETEVLEDLNLKSQKEENAESDKTELGQQVMENQTPDVRHGAAQSKRRQDFVKKNIELAGSSVLLTNQERERLEELLKDLEEDQNNTEPMSQHEVSLCAGVYGEGFSPEPSELKHLLHIDSRLQQLLPVNDFMSVRSSWTEAGSSQSLDEMKMGDRVLWYVRERREQEKRLREIQHQLQLLDEIEETDLIHLSDARSISPHGRPAPF
nr:fibrous sheath-interacting protein 1 isoform X2 [Misgurnus anguillicaudatus]